MISVLIDMYAKAEKETMIPIVNAVFLKPNMRVNDLAQ